MRAFLRRAGCAGAAMALAVGVAGGSAQAQTSPASAAAAEALYDEGAKLLDAGDFASACPKLAESFRLDPALGALLSLAVCRERAGQLASAWVTYLDLEARAKASGDRERAEVARERADALAPRLPRLRIELSPEVSALAGLQVTRDGQSVEPSVASTAVPVDPGDHVIVVRAPGRRQVEQRVILREAQVESVTIASLEVEASAAAPVPSTGPEPTPPPGQGGDQGGEGGLGSLQITGLVVGGVGLAALGVGAAFGVVALGKGSELDEHGYDSEDGTCTVRPGECPGLYDDARSAATLSTILVIGGSALAATGLVLVLAGGTRETGPHAGHLVLVPAPGGFSLRGAL